MNRKLEKSKSTAVSRWVGFLKGRRALAVESYLAFLIKRYFRLEVSDLDKIPTDRPCVIYANHSGFLGLDAVLLSYLVHRHIGKVPTMLAHPGYFDWFQILGQVCQTFGLERASVQNGVEILQQGQVVIIFPEGEEGNFKPSWERYELKKFHTGFVRMAAKAGVPVIPCMILGAEESHLNLGRLDLSRWVPRLKIPLPLNLVPLPSKWRVRVLDRWEPTPHLFENEEAVQQVTEGLRSRLEHSLKEAVSSRDYVFIPTPEWVNQLPWIQWLRKGKTGQ